MMRDRAKVMRIILIPMAVDKNKMSQNFCCGLKGDPLLRLKTGAVYTCILSYTYEVEAFVVECSM